MMVGGKEPAGVCQAVTEEEKEEEMKVQGLQLLENRRSQPMISLKMVCKQIF